MMPRFGSALLALLFLMQACSGGQRAYVPSPSTGGASSTLRAATNLPNGELYVINGATGKGSGSVAIYNLRTSRLVRILKSGIDNPVDVASDASDNLYVANAPESGSGSIAVYAPGSSTPNISIIDGIDRPSDLKIDSAGELVVANQGNGTIAYYPPAGTSLSRTVSNGVRSPRHIAIDAVFADLWVLNDANVTTYTPGTGAPANPVRAKFRLPSSMIFGGSNLYVADRLGGSVYGNVQIVSLSTLRPTGQIVQGIHTPMAMAFDHDRRLYVANDFSPGSVTVYDAASRSPQRKITKGISHPDALAVADDGWLYVANDAAGHASVAAYPPGKSSPAFRLAEGVTSPVGIRIRIAPATAPSAVVFHVPGNPTAITLGPDGKIWFVEEPKYFPSGTLASIDQNGNVTALTIPNGYYVPEQSSITRGPDGALWFEAGAYDSNSSSTTPGVGRIMPDGTGFAFFALPGANYPSGENIAGMTEGPDGAVWFTVNYMPAVERITPGGNLTSFATPRKFRAEGIVTGPDGALWFTEPGNGRIARLDTAGHFTEYHLPGVGRHGDFLQPHHIVVGPDGALWSLEDATGRIVRVTTSGKITTSAPAFFSGSDTQLAFGSDKGLWFTNGLGISSGSTTTLKPTHDILLASGGAIDVYNVTADAGGNLWFSVTGQNEVVRVTP